MTYTPVHNRFWADGWVRQLNALDRYLFLYLLTNGRAGRVGIYELPLDLMAAESGIDEKDLRLSMLHRLEPKVFYKEGWVIMVNYLKHLVGGGHKFNQGIKANFVELPEKIQALARDCGYPIDTLSIEYNRFPNRIEYNRIEENIDTYVISDEGKKTKTNLEGFESFWGLYPNKKNKIGASAEWRKLTTSDREAIMEDIPARLKSKDWLEEGGKYIPLPQNYLKNRRWEDEVREVPREIIRFGKKK